MRSYFYQWNEKTPMTPYLILYGGVRAILEPQIHRLAKERQIAIADLFVSPDGVKLSANKKPDKLVKVAGDYLKLANPSLRVEGDLLQAAPTFDPVA